MGACIKPGVNSKVPIGGGYEIEGGDGHESCFFLRKAEEKGG